jgi:hypothetical protein
VYFVQLILGVYGQPLNDKKSLVSFVVFVYFNRVVGVLGTW